MEEERLICFTHCRNIVSKSVPDYCPKCGLRVENDCRKPPYYFQCPIVNAHESSQKLSIVLKPYETSWERACASNDDLHIGISDEVGNVISYQWSGVTRESSGWNSSVVIYNTPEDCTIEWLKIWETIITDLESDIEWSPDRYDEQSHNCLDFVMAFLCLVHQEIVTKYDSGGLDFMKSLDQFRDGHLRRAFVDQYVLPKMEQAHKFILLRNEVTLDGYVVMNDSNKT